MAAKNPEQEGAVYSREFSGTPKLYLRVAIASGLYIGLGIFLVYGCIRFYFAGDASAFSARGLMYLGIFLVLYIPYAYNTMLKYDGLKGTGSSWVHKEVTVKLIERKEHRRFG